MEQDIRATLLETSTASVASALLKLGVRNVFIRGVSPIAGAVKRAVGSAFTLRFLPLREDLSGEVAARLPTSREGIEAMEPDSFAVIDAMGVTDAGVAGDVLCARMARRGVSGLLTDGAIRDLAGVEASGLPVWSRAVAAPAPGNSLTFVDWGLPIACGGVLVFPGDVIVADRDGAVVIPLRLAAQVAAAAAEIERFDAWVIDKVLAGEALPGLYPPNDANQRRYRQEVGSAD